MPQSLIYVFIHSGLRKHNPISENTLHDDPSHDDGTSYDDPKMINLRVNKEEGKHRVDEKPY